MSNTSGVYGACPDMVDPLSLTANIIQILTFTTVVLVGLLWRTSIVANAQYEAGSLYIEAEIRMEIWQTQIREFNTSTADVWRAQNTARYALNHAETNLDEFRALLERLGRAHLNKRTGRIRNLLVGFRYMRRRDELKAKLAKVECLMELADKVIDQHEIGEIGKALARIDDRLLGLEVRADMRRDLVNESGAEIPQIQNRMIEQEEEKQKEADT